MCGRYALHANPEVVALQFGLDSLAEFRPSYNIAPAAEILVVRPGAAVRARWGLRGRFVNLRAETVLSRFATSGRCLVPASGFYEWKAEGRRKQPYYFSPRRDALLALAALWERDTCSLITTDPNPVVRAVHDRMPLMVPKRLYQAWLHGDETILRSPSEIELRAHPVSMAVNQAANDSPEMIEPIELARGLFD
jgi:putative SOS response-associated peptidase YedK